MDNKKKILKRLIIGILIVVTVWGITQFYRIENERQIYLHNKNTYELNYHFTEETEGERHTVTAELNTPISSLLPTSGSETNLLGETVVFPVKYAILGKPFDNLEEKLVTDFVPNSKKIELTAHSINVKIYNDEKDYGEWIAVQVSFADYITKPIMISDDSKDYFLEAKSTTGSSSFKIPISPEIQETIAEFVSLRSPIQTFSLGEAVYALIDAAYCNTSDEQIVEKVFPVSGWENINSRFKNVVIETFMSLPRELREKAYFEGLSAVTSDFLDMDINRTRYTDIDFYAENIAANFSKKYVKISFNTHGSDSLVNFEEMQEMKRDLAYDDQIYSYTMKGSYHISKFGEKVLLNSNANIDKYSDYFLARAFRHEFGHFLEYVSDDETVYSEEMAKDILETTLYGTDEILDPELTASSFEIYFDDEDYLQKTLPEVHEILARIASTPSPKKVQFDEYLEIYENW